MLTKKEYNDIIWVLKIEQGVDKIPLVLISRNPEKINDDLLKALVEEVPGTVSRILNVPEVKEFNLIESDIEVWTQIFGDFDRNTPDLAVIVWVPECKERLQNKDERRGLINAKVENILLRNLKDKAYEIDGYVWLLFQPVSFGKLF